MHGRLTYDGDGNLLALADLFTGQDDERNPVIAKLTVAEMVEVLQRYQVDDAETLDRWIPYHDGAMKEMAYLLKDRIEQETVFTSYTNPNNGNNDLVSAMYVACEPGPPDLATFRLVEKS
jgi:hypothetical protein